MTELLVGTKKGLFVLEGEPGARVRGDRARVRRRAGRVRDARPAHRAGVLASVTSPFYGPKIWYADDPAGEWEQADGVALPEGGDAALERIWVIVAGRGRRHALRGRRPRRPVREPRRRRDAGSSTAALWEHPTRPRWQPGAGGLCLHSIVPWPGEPDRLALAISAAGVWLTDDGGATWRRGNEGLVAALPARGRAATTRSRSACTACSARRRGRSGMFMQFHGGVYRSDDAGESWTDIADGPAVGLRLPARARSRPTPTART